MQRLWDTLQSLNASQKVAYAASGVAVAGVCVVVFKKLFLREKKKREVPPNTVLLYQFLRGPYAPSLSPYVTKLETYLRVAKIPYQTDHTFTPSSKGRLPWIEYNNESVADSEFCIDFLNKKFNVDLNRDLSTKDRGVATALRVMVDEHMAWCLAMFRYIYDPEITLIKKAFSLNRFIIWMFKRRVRSVVFYQGTGRHSKEEVTLLLERDLHAIADILGQKKFLFGEIPCVADCAVFGQLSQLYWHCVGNDAEHMITDKFPALAAYCERFKSTYWPDWDDCTTRGFTAEATR